MLPSHFVFRTSKYMQDYFIQCGFQKKREGKKEGVEKRERDRETDRNRVNEIEREGGGGERERKRETNKQTDSNRQTDRVKQTEKTKDRGNNREREGVVSYASAVSLSKRQDQGNPIRSLIFF